MSKAAPSGRAANKVQFNFVVPLPGGGAFPVSLPVSLFTGVVSDHGIKRSRYIATDDGDHEVGNKNYDKTTGEDIAFSDIVMKVHTEHGPVYVEDQEIEKLFEISPDTITIKAFQPQHLFHQGHYVPKSLQFLEPQVVGTGKRKGHDQNAVTMLATLFKAMREKGACAVVEVTTRGVPKPAVLLPDGSLWFVYHTDALREQREAPEFEPQAPQVALFSGAIDAQWSTDVLDLTDERSALIQSFADEKAAAGDFARPETVEVAAPKPVATDMMSLLMASVEAAKTA